jgi:murein DD-endopeptidase MepM/ murein hydrolase activator NlpD
VGLLAAGCADSGRFASNDLRPQADVTGSITQPTPAPTNRVIAQPLPAPAAARPATIAPPGSATSAESLSAYRPGTRSTDITGSVPAPAPTGHWTWDGGSAVVVGQGQTLEQIAHKYGVPAAAIMQVNHLASATAIRPGQHLVIPRYVSANAPAVPTPKPRVAETVHVVAPGETLMIIARKHGVTLSALARANKINAFGKLSIGERLIVPGGKRVVAEQRPPVAKPAQPGTAAPEIVATVPPAENVRLAKPDVEPTATRNGAIKTAEPAGAMPSFHWPVKARITSGFGVRPDGTRNDGIDMAVPAGTPIKASDGGVVAYSGDELKGYGNLVLIRHANGFVSAYANASELLVKRGDTVKRGQIIARAGQTGNATAPQLHFEIRKGPVPVDPTKYLNGA